MGFVKKIMDGKNVYLVENHHEVLIPWALERQKKSLAPFVLTLDHHTDTLPAFDFRQRNQLHIPENLKLPDAVELLHHDEHLDYAIKQNFIKASILFPHVNFAKNVNPQIHIIHDPETPPYPQHEADLPPYRIYAESILSDSFFLPRLEKSRKFGFHCESVDYLLDIDLDFFQTKAAFNTTQKNCFHKLIHNARAITISMESIWVSLLKLKNETWTAKEILQLLLSELNKKSV